MPAQGGASGRWTATRPDEEIKPVGPDDCVRKAVEKLGPFKHRLQDDAERVGPREGLDGRLALSEQLAWEQVWTLAKTYNRQRQLDQNAPRSKHVVERLAKLEILTGELACHLASLDDITRHRLQTGGTGISSFNDFYFPLRDEADVTGLPAPAGWNSPEEPSRWIKRLEALSQYANFTQTVFLRSRGIDSADQPDKGGNTNLYKALYGSAQWSLVNGGWHLYELFKPGKTTGTEGGPFHLFLLDVFEYATGQDPEEHSKLEYWLKRVSRVNRQYREIVSRQGLLRAERDAIEESDSMPISEDGSKRCEEIDREMIALERDRLELWPYLYPYSYPEARAG
jgi:hypothetical protein